MIVFRLASKCFTSKSKLVLCLLASALFSTGTWTQTQLGSVFGVITDTSGAVVPGVNVTLSSADSGVKRESTTDGEGRYHLAGLSFGIYTLRAEKEGFKSEVTEGVALTSPAPVTVNVSLRVGAVKEEVRAEADSTTVDNISSTVGGIISEGALRELPLNGRDLFQAALLEPGVAPTPSAAPSLFSNGKFGQVAINGLRPSWTNVTIDGMDANEPNFGLSPAGASGLFLGLDELAELHILTQTFSAEYGRNGGAIIEAVTRSGTNQFHGSLFELNRNAALDAKNYFDLSDRHIPHFVRNQFGGSSGGPLVHDRTFFFGSYEGFRQVQASTAIATVPDALAHKGLLPSASNPTACSAATPNGCVAIGVDPRVQPDLLLFPPSNGKDNGDGTADLITANSGNTNEHHGMARVDQIFSNVHSLFVRYIIDDSSSFVPYFGTPPGTYLPDFPLRELGRNQYFAVQDRKNFGGELFNEIHVGINRTTASTSILAAHSELSFSLVPSQPFGMVSVAGLSLLGNNPLLPLGSFSTTYQLQDQISGTRGHHTLKFGAEFARVEVNGRQSFTLGGLYIFQDLSPLGILRQTINPSLEFFLEAQPTLFVGSDPGMSDSDRGYRQSVLCGFAQDYFRATNRLVVSAGLRYDFYSNPSEAHGRLSAIRNPAKDSGPTVGKLFAQTPLDLFSPQLGFAWTLSGDGKTVLRGGFGIFRNEFFVNTYGIDRFLPPFYGVTSSLLPTFLNPLNSPLRQPVYPYSMTYRPKFAYALQYNFNLEHEIMPNMLLTAGYFGARGNHLTRAGEQNPFEPAQGRQFNPNLPSFLTALTDAQSFYNSLEVGISKRYRHGLSFDTSYTFSHSIDDASTSFFIEAVNEAPVTQDLFNRKGDRGRSEFDIRHNFVANVVYEMRLGHRKGLGGWQISGITRAHSDVPFTPVLSFDNGETRSLVSAGRPNLIGNPYSGFCPNGAKVGTPACWFNPSAFALPPLGHFGNAARNVLRGPMFAQFDLALRKSFQLSAGKQIMFGVEAFNLLNHPNFAVPSNTQSFATQGGNGDAVFKDPTGNFADNVARIVSTVGSARQIEAAMRFVF